MSDLSELDTPLPPEDEGRRWVSGAFLVASGACAILLGLAFFFLPRPMRATPATANITPVAVLKESSKPTAIPPVQSMKKRAGRELRAAPGLQATFLDVVRRNNAKAFVGRILRFDSINVVTTPKPGVLSVGPSPVDSVMVRLDPHEKTPSGLAPGGKVFLVGRLMPAPSEETMRRWGLTEEDQDRIGHRALYIRAMVLQDAPAHY